MIKSKPDIKSFNKDPNDFLEGGEADKALSKSRQVKEQPEVEASAAQPMDAFKPEPTVQKLFRLRWDIANALKLGAAQESARTGKRVTETDIVQQLLKKHYSLK
ncbi:hypothetical protein KDX38_18345 [Pseudomonas sp. CDFA 602]|uniref:hypothetical protein n=1 Tax=Pseudomonas californiensis TaxID=2829823 RepID=UPI001E560B1B|nr:hypothetical protein [Pseudomonas californiensis]MCD5995574.1 hypothetical protein [Pseudomonas californiensis]MCD6001168.1 hypothetical protein [Pseudomonas californiensis]